MQSNVPWSLVRNEVANIQRSKFKRNSDIKTTFNAGQLIPIYLDEVVPSDTFNMDATLFGRMSTLIFPIMDNLFIDVHWFFCPERLLWANFKKAMGEVPTTDNPLNYTKPKMDASTYPALGHALYSLPDYLGLPILVPFTVPSATIDITSLPFRMYNLIYNNYYRDQNLQAEVFFDDSDSDDDYDDYVVLRRGKRKDYFTSAQINPQKLWLNDEAPAIPLTTGSASELVMRYPSSGAYTGQTLIRRTSTGAVWGTTNADGAGSNGTGQLQDQGNATLLSIDPNGTMNVTFDGSDLVTAGTINDLRVAVQMQRFLERDQRGGTRYPELVWSHFKTLTPDLMWRPEYLGGSSDRVQISPVQQTSETGTTPQGNLAAQGTLVSRSRFFKTFNEHGYVMGIASIRADLSYQQNCERLWFARTNRYEYLWPEFAHLGEQPLYTCEIFASEATWNQNKPSIGYVERFAEYKFKNSLVTGLFRSQAPSSLDAWHLAQEFSVAPTLGNTFIQENPPVDRVVAVNTEPQFIVNGFFRLTCARPLPMFSTPGMMDHF